MRYWPSESVTVDLVPSISTGLEASTVTPGSTAPLESLTVPVNALCAAAMDGNAIANAQHARNA